MLGALAVGAIAGYAWWATSLRPFTGPALGATVVGGLAAVAVGVWVVPTRRPTRLRPGGAVWVVLLVAVAAWELGSYFQLPRSEHPTLSSLANGVLSHHPARAAAMVAWLALGAAIARR